MTTRITSFHGSQTSPVVLCMQNNVISIRITSLYGSQPLSVVFACKTATLGPELQVSMGPSTHLWFCAFKTAALASEILVSMGPCLHLLFCAFKTAALASELQVSMGPSTHLWLLHAKQRLYDQNYKSLLVPTSPMGFCIQNGHFSTRIASLYGSQPSSVVFACKKATFGSELQVSMGPSLHLWFCACNTA